METRLLRLVRTLSEAWKEPWSHVKPVGEVLDDGDVFFWGVEKDHWKVMPGRGGSNPMGLGF